MFDTAKFSSTVMTIKSVLFSLMFGSSGYRCECLLALLAGNLSISKSVKKVFIKRFEYFPAFITLHCCLFAFDVSTENSNVK